MKTSPCSLTATALGRRRTPSVEGPPSPANSWPIGGERRATCPCRAVWGVAVFPCAGRGSVLWFGWHASSVRIATARPDHIDPLYTPHHPHNVASRDGVGCVEVPVFIYNKTRRVCDPNVVPRHQLIDVGRVWPPNED